MQKRVTVAEMMAIGTFVDCFDEISTGLDAATTYDICRLLGEVNRMRKSIRLVSLLQPPPETVALFDEVILLDQGRVLYTGPVDEVIQHFRSLGYHQPERMDPADFLQSLPSKDGAKYLADPDNSTHLSNKEFVEKYNESQRGQGIIQKLESTTSGGSPLDHDMWKKRYANGTWDSVKIVFAREFLLWWRDKYARMARLAQDLIMGVIVGTVFWQVDDPGTVMGVVFQCVFFIAMGAMLKVAPQIDIRGIFYKEQDANFYPTWIYVLARALAGLPTSVQDAFIYGSLIYWMSGFAATAENYILFIILTLLCAFTCGLMFSIFSATIRDRPSAQAAMSIAIVIMVLFSGFTVQPDVIPPYYIWIYWMNLFSWVIRGVIINEYQSGEHDDGDIILERFGFTFDGEPFEFVWVYYTIAFCLGLCMLSCFASVWALDNIRFATGGSLGGSVADTPEDATDVNGSKTVGVTLEAKGATLTFKDVHYTVTSSITNEKLHLLKGVSGFFPAGKMTALMGSSGAGECIHTYNSLRFFLSIHLTKALALTTSNVA
jgi:ABC-type multidrug transport system ATPase subunit